MSRFSEIQKQRESSHRGPGQGQGVNTDKEAYVPGSSSPFVEAFGGAMVRGARGLGNMLYRMGNYQPDTPELAQERENLPFFGDKAIREQEKLDRPLKQQPGAGIGGFLGSVVSTPGLPGEGLVLKEGNLLRKALGSRAANRATEGAVSSAEYADPESMQSAGTTGSVLSLALGRGGDLGGRLMRGLVKKSEAAQHLEHLAAQNGENVHIPISLSADANDPVSAAVGGAYRNVAPMIPFVGQRLEGQREKARKQLRDITMREASPTGLNLTERDLSSSDRALEKISDEFMKQYDSTVKSYAFNVPSDFGQQITALIKKDRPNIDQTTLADTTKQVQDILARFSDGKNVITGDNLLYAKKEIGDLIKGSKVHERDTYKSAVKWIDDHIVNELSQGNSPANRADLRKYLDLSEPWKAKVATEKAAARSFLGQFGPEDLYKTSRPGTTTRELGRAGAEVLEPNATKQSLEGKILGGVALGGIGHFMSWPAAAGLAAAGHAAASPGMQRVLTGDLAIQQWLNGKLPADKTKAITSALRRGAAAQTGDTYDGPEQ